MSHHYIIFTYSVLQLSYNYSTGIFSNGVLLLFVLVLVLEVLLEVRVLATELSGDKSWHVLPWKGCTCTLQGDWASELCTKQMHGLLVGREPYIACCSLLGCQFLVGEELGMHHTGHNRCLFSQWEAECGVT